MRETCYPYGSGETIQDVWFDNFKVLSQGSILVQETHYDPWGLELTGIGYEYAGVKKNKYLYQGKEMLDDHNLNIYDFHARGYDPVIGRTWQIDPGSESYYPMSPYSWVMNNPLKFIDPTGMFADYFDGSGKFKGTDGNDDGEIRVLNGNPEGLYKADGKRIDENVGKNNSKLLDKVNFKGNEKALENILNHYLAELGYDKNGKVQYDVRSTMRGDPKKDQILISLKPNGYLNKEDFNNYYNLKNTAVHERYHVDHHLGVNTDLGIGSKNHLQAYWAQIDHSTWKNVTTTHRGHIIGNIGHYITYIDPKSRTTELNRFQNKMGIKYEWVQNQGYKKWSQQK